MMKGDPTRRTGAMMTTRLQCPRCWGGATAQDCQRFGLGTVNPAWLGARTHQVAGHWPDLGGLVRRR